jgi:acetone carboxylase gamma subunit
MSPNFKTKIMDGYRTDARYSKILKVIQDNNNCDVPVGLPYEEQDGLLLHLAHNEAGHQGLNRILENLHGISIYKDDKKS